MTDSKLLSCPFCQCKLVQVIYKKRKLGGYAVKCANCDCTAGYASNENDATIYWNTRVNSHDKLTRALKVIETRLQGEISGMLVKEPIRHSVLIECRDIAKAALEESTHG